MQAPNRGNPLISRIAIHSDLADNGLATEVAGPRSVKVSLNGRFQGVWRQRVGSYEWYPAGYNMPQFQAPTVEDAVRHMTRLYGAAA